MKPEKAQLVVQGLKEAGVDFAAGVPDAQFIEVYKMLAEDRDIHYVGAANEAEATGIGFGAWFGGKKPALILATSGLLVATYHLARINLLHEVPVLVVIPYRARSQGHGYTLSRGEPAGGHQKNDQRLQRVRPGLAQTRRRVAQ